MLDPSFNGKEDELMPVQNDEKMKGGRSLWEMGDRDGKEETCNNQIFETGGEGDAPADRRARFNISITTLLKEFSIEIECN